MSDERYSQYNFARWLRVKLRDHGVSVKTFSDETGLVYAYVSRLVNSGDDKPIGPKEENLGIMADALVRLGVIAQRDEAFLAAGYEVSGYVTVRPEDLPKLLPPEGFEIPQLFRDNPEELQSLLRQFEGLPDSEVRRLIKLTAEMIQLIRANDMSIK